MIPLLVQGDTEPIQLRTFKTGTAPTVVLTNGTGDENYGIRPLQFFEYDSYTYGLLYLAQATSANETRTIKLATASKSGFNHVWTKQGTVLNNGASDQWDYKIGGGSVVRNGGEWILLYDSFGEGKIGVATGTDLLSMTKNVNNPVLDNSASTGAFNRYLRHPSANILGNTLYCHYEGRSNSPSIIVNSKLGYATASLSDLTTWTISSNVLIDGTDVSYANGVNTAIVNANILKIDGYYYWWFQGYVPQNGGVPFELGGTSYAYSRDLVNWTIVGTENYHIQTSLFGYNSSNDFYETCQENTAVFANGEMSIYMWDLTSSNIGRVILNGDAFVNTFRGFDMSDNFDDNSIDTNKWTTGTGSGITVSETGGKLQIVADGVGSEASEPVMLESKTSLNNDDVGSIICCFNLERSTPTTGDLYAVELSDSTRNNGIRLERSTTANKIECKIIEAGSTTNTTTLDFDGDDTFKIVIFGRTEVVVFKGVNGTFTSQYSENVTSFTNIDWTFKVVVNNSAGQTISIDNFAIGQYDSGQVSTFQT